MTKNILVHRDRLVARLLDRLGDREVLTYKYEGAKRGLEMCQTLRSADEFRAILCERRAWEQAHDPVEMSTPEDYMAYWGHKSATNYIELVFAKLKEKYPKLEDPIALKSDGS